MTDRVKIQTLETTGSSGDIPVRSTNAPGVAWTAVGTTDAVKKASDENVNNSTTLQNDDELTLTLAAGTYVIDAILFMNLAGNSGVKIGLNGTCTVSSMKVRCAIYDASGIREDGRITALGGSVSHGASGSGDHYCEVKGTITVSVAGTLVLQFAQQTAVAANCTMQAGSSIWRQRIA